MRDFSLAGWVLAFILAAFLYSEKVADGFSFGSRKTKQETQTSQPQQSVAKSNRPPPSTFKREPPPSEHEPDCKDPKHADLCAQRRMAAAAEEQGRLNILGLILLAATLGFTGWAAISARSAARATRDAAIAAQRSASTAINTLETMQDTAQRELRAYVSIVKATYSFGGTANMRYGNPSEHRLDFSIRFKNAGQTPAYDVTWWTRVGVTLTEELVVLGEAVDPEHRSRVAVLGPGVDFTTMDERASSPLEVENIKRGVYTAYIWGRVDYRDAFDKEDRYINIFGIVRKTASGAWIVQPHKDSNDAN